MTIQPLNLLAIRRNLPSEMRSAEWSRVPQWTRERSFYMAGVTRTEILQEMRDIVTRSASGEAGEFELRKQWEAALDAADYQPEAGQEGTIKDLRSLRRFNVALRTNRALMNGWALKENGLRPGPIQAQPGWELVRFREAKAPRDWVERFVASGGTVYEGRLIAAKTDAVWGELGSVERYDDGLGVDYPPFAWGSGMNLRGVGAREMLALGVMTREQILAQRQSAETTVIASPNASLESAPLITDQDLRDSLATDLGGLAEWSGDTLLFTDPNGTRPTDEAGLTSTWSAPLPAALHDIAPDGLFQRQAALDFGDDPERFARRPDRDQWDDLARAVARLADPAQARRTMSAVASRDDLSWVEILTGSPIWRDALALSSLAPRAVAIVSAIRALF